MKLLTAVIIIASLLVLIWGFDKAFDFTDAGYYLLRYQDNQPLEFGGHMYEHVLVRAVLPANMRKVIPLRFIGLLINLLSSVCLSLAITNVLKRWKGLSHGFPFVFLMVFSGLVFSYAGSPSELSYNSLNQFFLISGSAWLVLAVGGGEKYKLLYAAAAGAMLSVCVLVKLPTGLGAAAIGSVMILLSDKKRGWALLIFWMAGAAVLGAVALLLKPSFITYYANYYQYLSKYIIYDADLLIKSLKDIVFININVLWKASLVILCARFAQIARKPTLKVLLYYAAICIAGIFVILRTAHHMQGQMLMSDFILFFGYVLCGYAIFIYRSKSPPTISGCICYIKDNLGYLTIVIMLVFLPYLGALGSSNPLNWGAKFYYASLMGGVAMIAMLSLSTKAQKLTLLLAVYLSVAGLFQYVQHPYRSQPLYLHNNNFRGIKYDYHKWAFLHQTETILNRYGFRAEQGMIAVYKNPGLAYLFGSFQPGSVLWSKETEDLYFAILDKSKVEMMPVILSIGQELSVEFSAKLNAAMKIDFYRDYHLTAKYPYYEPGISVFVYFPN
jgi:hypothetical protein